jgi:AraC-like DNA-binding protein
MSLQPIIFLLLFGGLQGILLIVFLLRRKLQHNAYIFLLCYLGVLLLQLTLKVMSKIWLMENWPVFYSLAHYLPLLYGPFLFLFVQGIFHDNKDGAKTFIHFIPFISFWLLVTVAETVNVPSFVEMILYNPQLRATLLMVSLGWYHWKAFAVWQEDISKTEKQNREINSIRNAWIHQFIRISFIVCMVIVIALYLLYMNYPSGHGYRYGFVALTLFIYWITWSALKQPGLFLVVGGAASVHPQQLPVLFVHRRIKKYARSTLDQKEKQRIASALQLCMDHDKLYLDPSITIDQLAGKIECTRHILSQVMNEYIGKSFYDYINHYRVEEAKTLLLSSEKKHFKIASIAYDAGFNSLSTFNDVFRKTTGCTPSQFTKQVSVRQRV